jgi:hypothetical protein
MSGRYSFIEGLDGIRTRRGLGSSLPLGIHPAIALRGPSQVCIGVYVSDSSIVHRELRIHSHSQHTDNDTPPHLIHQTLNTSQCHLPFRVRLPFYTLLAHTNPSLRLGHSNPSSLLHWRQSRSRTLPAHLLVVLALIKPRKVRTSQLSKSEG